jgi:hypothetical protein
MELNVNVEAANLQDGFKLSEERLNELADKFSTFYAENAQSEMAPARVYHSLAQMADTIEEFAALSAMFTSMMVEQGEIRHETDEDEEEDNSNL